MKLVRYKKSFPTNRYDRWQNYETNRQAEYGDHPPIYALEYCVIMGKEYRQQNNWIPFEHDTNSKKK
jgi:hypothetical protein